MTDRSRGCIFSHVWPYYERAVSNQDSSMQISLSVWVTHSSFIEGSFTTKNMASEHFKKCKQLFQYQHLLLLRNICGQCYKTFYCRNHDAIGITPKLSQNDRQKQDSNPWSFSIVDSTLTFYQYLSTAITATAITRTANRIPTTMRAVRSDWWFCRRSYKTLFHGPSR